MNLSFAQGMVGYVSLRPEFHHSQDTGKHVAHVCWQGGLAWGRHHLEMCFWEMGLASFGEVFFNKMRAIRAPHLWWSLEGTARPHGGLGGKPGRPKQLVVTIIINSE